MTTTQILRCLRQRLVVYIYYCILRMIPYVKYVMLLKILVVHRFVNNAYFLILFICRTNNNDIPN